MHDTNEAFVTIAACNYLAHVSSWAGSLRINGYRGPIYLLLIDGLDARLDSDLKLTVITVNDLPDRRDLLRVRKHYSLIEYATALKPYLLLHLLSTHERVTYMDPDTFVYSRLPTSAFSEQHPIELTPHRLSPIPKDGLLPEEDLFTKVGTYNLGYIAVRRDGVAAMEWWASLLLTQSLIDFSNALYTDQKWADLLPVYFRTTIRSEPGMNVGPWNVDERQVVELGYEDASSRLLFAHFSGFRLAGKRPDARHRVSQHTKEAERFCKLAEDYLADVSAQHFTARSDGLGFTTSSLVRTARRRHFSGQQVHEGSTQHSLSSRPYSSEALQDYALALLRDLRLITRTNGRTLRTNKWSPLGSRAER